MRIVALRKLSLDEQLAQLRTLIRSPMVIELHTLEATDTIRINRPVEILVKDYHIERKQFERIDTQKCPSTIPSAQRTYCRWTYGGAVDLSALLKATIEKFRREHSCEPQEIFVAEGSEETARKILAGTKYMVYGQRRMPSYAVVAESKKEFA